MHNTPPILRDGQPERSATWLELFFDLVFVVAIAQLSYFLKEDLSWSHFVDFALLFLPIWWLWMEYSYYADLYDTQSSFFRFTTISIMFGMIVMATLIHRLKAEALYPVVMTYAVLTGINWVQYVRTYRKFPKARILARYQVFGLPVIVGLLLVVWWLRPPHGDWLAAGVVLLQMAISPVAYLTTGNFPKQQSHMPERFGLFTIIVLGETIVAVAQSLIEEEWTTRNLFLAVLGFSSAVLMWWLYFYRSDREAISKALDDRSLLKRSFFYGYSHYFTFVAVAAFGIAWEEAIIADTIRLAPHLIAFIIGTLGLFLLSLGVMHWAMPNQFPPRVIMLRLGAVGLIVLLTQITQAEVWILPGIFAVLATLCCTEYYIKLRQMKQSEERERTAA